MAKSRMKRKKGKYKKLLRTFTIIGMMSFVFLGILLTIVGFKLASVTTGVGEDLERGQKSELRKTAVDPEKDNISILFLGVDDRDGTLQGRTDALIVATFNKELGTIKMTSIPRDSLVDIPGRKNQDKINHAHAFGGTERAIETVEQLLDIPIDYFVKLNFTAFIEIVDALGGIEIDVPFTFTEMDSNDRAGAITIREGTQLLNGEEALAYARMRKKDPRGDIGRGERQQEVIKAIIKKTATLSSITSYGDLLNSIEKHVSTNLSFSDVLALHSYANSISEIESLSLEGDNIRRNGVSYYKLREDSVAAVSAEFQDHLRLH